MTAHVGKKAFAGDQTLKSSRIWSTGLAIFAMFFGAGNIIFPLALGQFTQDKTFYGILGLLVTAVIVPMMGLIAMLLFDGEYAVFFRRIGKIPGFFVTIAILGLIGPFGGIPRCITISFSTLEACDFAPLKWMNLLSFSSLTCALLFLFAYRPRRIVSLLGLVLTPLLLLSLGVIVTKGFLTMPIAEASAHTPLQTFLKGLLDGYNTLDLLAAFFFSSVVLLCLRKNGDESPSGQKNMLKMAIWGSCIAAVLLGVVYICFTYLAAGNSQCLKAIASDQLLGALAYKVLGPHSCLIASTLVYFACFTTEIALTTIFATFLHKVLAREKISYTSALIITLAMSLCVSTLHFSGISAFLEPIVQVCYPALIVLSILNILYKLYDFKPVKFFFYSTIVISLITLLLH